MKRIDIMYGGEHYSIGGQELERLKDEIVEGVTKGVSWLSVNDGEGAPRQAFLLLSPGTPIAVIPIPDAVEIEAEGPGIDGSRLSPVD